MTLKEYLKSTVFGVQLLLALGLIAVIGYLFMHWLTFTTDHGHEIIVPDLRKMTEQQVEDAVDELNLEYVLLDSVDYNSQFPKHTVVEQDPLPGSKVKVNRKTKSISKLEQSKKQVTKKRKRISMSKSKV